MTLKKGWLYLPAIMNDYSLVEVRIDCEAFRKEVDRIGRLLFGQEIRYDLRKRPGFFHNVIFFALFKYSPLFKKIKTAQFPGNDFGESSEIGIEHLNILINWPDLKRVFSKKKQTGKVSLHFTECDLDYDAYGLKNNDIHISELGMHELISEQPQIFFQRMESDKRLWCFAFPEDRKKDS